MLKKLFFVFLFFPILLSISKCDADQKEKRIAWSSDNQLTWDDFKGKVDKKDETYKAKTYVKVTSFHEVYDNNIVLNVTCKFNQSISWSKSKTESWDLLKHEQLHFDICELMARNIRKEFSEHKSYQLSATWDTLQNIYDFYFPDSLTKLNIKYDKETDHGTIIDEQRRWEKFIDRELRKLNHYSDTVVKIRRMTVN